MEIQGWLPVSTAYVEGKEVSGKEVDISGSQGFSGNIVLSFLLMTLHSAF